MRTPQPLHSSTGCVLLIGDDIRLQKALLLLRPSPRSSCSVVVRRSSLVSSLPELYKTCGSIASSFVRVIGQYRLFRLSCYSALSTKLHSSELFERVFRDEEAVPTQTKRKISTAHCCWWTRGNTEREKKRETTRQLIPPTS